MHSQIHVTNTKYLIYKHHYFRDCKFTIGNPRQSPITNEIYSLWHILQFLIPFFNAKSAQLHYLDHQAFETDINSFKDE